MSPFHGTKWRTYLNRHLQLQGWQVEKGQRLENNTISTNTKIYLNKNSMYSACNKIFIKEISHAKQKHAINAVFCRIFNKNVFSFQGQNNKGENRYCLI